MFFFLMQCRVFSNKKIERKLERMHFRKYSLQIRFFLNVAVDVFFLFFRILDIYALWKTFIEKFLYNFTNKWLNKQFLFYYFYEYKHIEMVHKMNVLLYFDTKFYLFLINTLLNLAILFHIFFLC